MGCLGVDPPVCGVRVCHHSQGNPVKLSELKGKQACVVEMWATWCPPCRDSIPHLSALQKQFPNVCFIGMTDEKAAVARPFVEKMGSKMEYRCDAASCCLFHQNMAFSHRLASLATSSSISACASTRLGAHTHRTCRRSAHKESRPRLSSTRSARCIEEFAAVIRMRCISKRLFSSVFFLGQFVTQAGRIVWSGHPSDAEFEAVLTRVQAEPGASRYSHISRILSTLADSSDSTCFDTNARPP